MSSNPPGEDEVLQAADLSATEQKETSSKKPFVTTLLLIFLLSGWSAGVYVYFSRPDKGEADMETPEVATPLPVAVNEEVTVTAPPVPTSTPVPVHVSRVVKVLTNPPGASVLVDQVFTGNTPLELSEPAKGQTVLFQLRGFKPQSVVLNEGHLRDGISVELEPITAKVHIERSPVENSLLLNGYELVLPEDGKLTLPLVSHELTVTAKGYETQTIRFTPAEAYERKIVVRLLPVKSTEEKNGSPPEKALNKKNFLGIEMIGPELPLTRQLGSLRGSAGHQSNEVMRNVELTRAFQISKTEISNAQYRKFKPSHDSGRWKGVNLNEDAFPVTGITWQEAVEFCNWLSEQEGLPKAYVKTEDRWEYLPSPGTGYRLPTEAEWESMARLEAKDSLYGWGNELPPPSKGLNFAGKESSRLMGNVLVGYSDSFTGPAPVDQAGEGPSGILGMYDNVLEWVQDRYSIPDVTSKVQENPEVSASGKFHVMKGASWQDAGIVDLRIARRRYGDQAAVDLGFRVARTVLPGNQ